MSIIATATTINAHFSFSVSSSVINITYWTILSRTFSVRFCLSGPQELQKGNISKSYLSFDKEQVVDYSHATLSVDGFGTKVKPERSFWRQVAVGQPRKSIKFTDFHAIIVHVEELHHEVL